MIVAVKYFYTLVAKRKGIEKIKIKYSSQKNTYLNAKDTFGNKAKNYFEKLKHFGEKPKRTIQYTRIIFKILHMTNL